MPIKPRPDPAKPDPTPPFVPPSPAPIEPEPDPKPPEPVAVAFKIPTGVPATPRPKGGRWFAWDARPAALYARLVAIARDYALDPALFIPVGMVESDLRQINPETGKPWERWDNFPQDGPSVGMFQVKPKLWSGLVPGADAYTEEGNARIAAALLSLKIRERGSWEEAIVRDYFPTNDPNGTTQSAYVKTIRGLMGEIRAVNAGAPAPLDPWRPYPWPKMRRAIVAKPYDGAGFTRCALRRDRIRAIGTHITDGDPGGDEIEWYRAFFATGGARAGDALVDLVTARDGEIGLLNDWRDPDAGGTRAGWAIGWGPDGPGIEGEGVAFYRAFPSINEVIVSNENVAKAGQVWTDAMIAANIEIKVAFAQSRKIPAASWPIDPATGVSADVMHADFARKSCPAEPYISTVRPVMRAEIKKRLASWQGGDSPAGPRPDPDVFYTRWGFEPEQIERFFGFMERENADGTIDEGIGFNWQGALSLHWLKRCESVGVFPEAERIWFTDARKIPGGVETFASFEGGWVAFQPAGGRAAWEWLDGWTPPA